MSGGVLSASMDYTRKIGIRKGDKNEKGNKG